VPEIIAEEHKSWGEEHYHRRSILFAENLKNVRILGHGTIDGNVHQFNDAATPNLLQRSIHNLRFIRCENVEVRGIRLVNPVLWTQVYSECKNLLIDGIEVDSWQEQKNGDGLDLDSCENVIVRNSRFRSEDDAICLKTLSTAPMKNVLIENCVVTGTRCHAIKIGTETQGSVANVTIRNCKIETCRGAICLYMVDGGTMSDVLVENIEILDAQSALSIRLGSRNRTYAGGPAKTETGGMRNITVRNVNAKDITTRHECFIAGLPGHPIENVTLENIRIQSIAGGSERDRAIQPELRETVYPDPGMFGELPAWGMWIRDVNGLALHNIDLACQPNEGRFALVFDRTQNIALHDVIVDRVKAPLVELRGGTTLDLTQISAASGRIRLATEK